MTDQICCIHAVDQFYFFGRLGGELLIMPIHTFTNELYVCILIIDRLTERIAHTKVWHCLQQTRLNSIYINSPKIIRNDRIWYLTSLFDSNRIDKSNPYVKYLEILICTEIREKNHLKLRLLKRSDSLRFFEASTAVFCTRNNLS